MHNSQLELSSKRVELNVCESFKYLTKELLSKYSGEGEIKEQGNFDFAFCNNGTFPSNVFAIIPW